MKKRVIMIFVAFALLSCAVLLRMSRFYESACYSYAESGIKGRITQDINVNISKALNEKNIKTNDYIDINYNNNDAIASVNINSINLDSLALELSDTVYESINDADNSFGFPIGNTFGFEYLSGKGPNIKVKVVPVGAVEYDIGSELVSGGINQTLYRVIITYKTKISCIAPFFDAESEIVTKIIVCEILIVGAVPEIMLPFIE